MQNQRIKAYSSRYRPCEKCAQLNRYVNDRNRGHFFFEKPAVITWAIAARENIRAMRIWGETFSAGNLEHPMWRLCRQRQCSNMYGWSDRSRKRWLQCLFRICRWANAKQALVCREIWSPWAYDNCLRINKGVVNRRRSTKRNSWQSTCGAAYRINNIKRNACPLGNWSAIRRWNAIYINALANRVWFYAQRRCVRFSIVARRGNSNER